MKEYSSQSKAAKAVGVYQGAIFACCRGLRKEAGGFTWKYASEDGHEAGNIDENEEEDDEDEGKYPFLLSISVNIVVIPSSLHHYYYHYYYCYYWHNKCIMYLLI